MTRYPRRWIEQREQIRRWIDPRLLAVRAADIESYLRKRGWKIENRYAVEVLDDILRESAAAGAVNGAGQDQANTVRH